MAAFLAKTLCLQVLVVPDADLDGNEFFNRLLRVVFAGFLRALSGKSTLRLVRCADNKLSAALMTWRC